MWQIGPGKEIKIKIIQTVLEKNFTVKYNKKIYYIGFLASDRQILGLINRNTWEILDEELEELCLCEFREATKKEKWQIKNNIKLANKLISFCIKHFDDYKPKLNI